MIVLTFVDDSIAIHKNPRYWKIYFYSLRNPLRGAFKFEKDVSLTVTTRHPL
jgi:hypothetical protein